MGIWVGHISQISTWCILSPFCTGFRRFLGLHMSGECDAKRDVKTACDDAEMGEMMYKSATQLRRVDMQK